MTEEEAREYTARTGRRIIRPLATKSEARVAYGVKRHVLDAMEPFIVTCNHGGDGFRGLGLNEPFPTVTRSRDAHGLVVPTIAPFISHGQHGGRSRSIKDPHHAVTASRKDQNQVIAVHIAQHNTGVIGRGANVPLSTIMSRGTTQALVAATFIKRDFGNSIGSDMKDPVGAVTAGGGGKTLLAAAYMMSFKGSNRRTGRCENPHPAICASGQHSAVITMPLMTAYYSEGGQTASIRDPMLAVPTKARFGLAEVYGFEPPLTDDQLRRARQVADFLRKYGCWDDREFVTIEKAGRILVLIDIGMRMLKPRELARAQGLSDRYILAAPYNGGYLSETEQRHKIGNMVCPQPAAAVIVENYRPPLEWGQTDFMEAAE